MTPFDEEVAEAVNLGLVTVRDLCDEFDVSIDTVERWISGVNKPLPAFEKKVRDYLADMAAR